MLLRLQIVSSGSFLVLKQDGTLTVDIHTTLFNNQDDFLGSLSYPFEFPLEPNRAMLKNAHYISTSAQLRTMYVMIWLGYLPWKQVKMSFTIQDDMIEANCYIDSTLISAALSNLKLWQTLGSYQGVPSVATSEVDTSLVGGMAAFMKSCCVAAPGTMPMVFAPFRDDGAYKPERIGLTMNNQPGGWDGSTNTPVLHDNNGIGVSPVGTAAGNAFLCTVSGSVYLDDGPPTGSPTAVLAGDWLVWTDDGRWVVTDNPYGVPLDGFTDLLFPTEQVVNRWEIADHLGNSGFKIDPSTTYLQTQSPLFFAWFMLKRICDYFGYTIEGKVMKEEWFQRITIWSRVAVDKTYVIPDISYFMPDESCADYLKALRARAGLMIDFDATRMVCIVESLVNLETTGDIMDLRALQVRSYRETTNNSTFYVISQNPDGDDGAIPSNQVQQMQIGSALTADTETDITLTDVSTAMVLEDAAVNRMLFTPPVCQWRIPHIKQAIYQNAPFDQVCTVTPADQNNFKLRFLYWYGMQPNSSGFPYPYVSSDNLDINGAALSAFNLSLSPGPQDFSALQLYYNYLLNSKPFELGLNLIVAQLVRMRANMRFLVKDPFSFATVSCILDQLSADLEENAETIPAKITLYPKVIPDNLVQVINAGPVTPPPPPFDNGLVYARFSEINSSTTTETHPTEEINTTKDLFVEFFSDLAGTIPKSVTALTVGYSTTETIFNPGTGDSTLPTTLAYVSCNGVNATLYAAAPTSTSLTDGSGISISWVYLLLPSAYYTIIV